MSPFPPSPPPFYNRRLELSSVRCSSTELCFSLPGFGRRVGGRGNPTSSPYLSPVPVLITSRSLAFLETIATHSSSSTAAVYVLQKCSSARAGGGRALTTGKCFTHSTVLSTTFLPAVFLGDGWLADCLVGPHRNITELEADNGGTARRRGAPPSPACIHIDSVIRSSRVAKSKYPSSALRRVIVTKIPMRHPWRLFVLPLYQLEFRTLMERNRAESIRHFGQGFSPPRRHLPQTRRAPSRSSVASTAPVRRRRRRRRQQAASMSDHDVTYCLHRGTYQSHYPAFFFPLLSFFFSFPYFLSTFLFAGRSYVIRLSPA